MSKYIEQQPFSCGLSLVRNEKYEYAYINECGEEIVPFGKYSWCDPQFVCGYARVLIQSGFDTKKWGIIDTQGNIVVPIIYDNIWTLKEGYLSCIKAFQGEKEVTLSLVNLLKRKFILDGLTYIKSFSVEEFKNTFHVSRIDIKKEIATNGLFMEYGSNIGAVALTGIPEEPMFSIVVNRIGDMFVMLHKSEDLGKKTFPQNETAENSTISNQVRKKTGAYHKTSFADYENEKMNEDWSDPYGDIAAYNDGWDSDDVDSGLYDAYEGDYEEYNNR